MHDLECRKADASRGGADRTAFQEVAPAKASGSSATLQATGCRDSSEPGLGKDASLSKESCFGQAAQASCSAAVAVRTASGGWTHTGTGTGRGSATTGVEGASDDAAHADPECGTGVSARAANTSTVGCRDMECSWSGAVIIARDGTNGDSGSEATRDWPACSPGPAKSPARACRLRAPQAGTVPTGPG